MKRLSAKTYAQLYYASVTAAPTVKQAAVASRFHQLLRRHRAVKLLPRIMFHLQCLDDQAHGRTRVAVTAPASDLARLEPQLTTIFGPVVIDLTVDPALRGGLVLQVGDDTIDGSLRTRLRHLHHHLTQT